MKNYLSFGAGVNSVAMYLFLRDENVEFEAVFIDHGTDWPETYEYVDMFKAKYPLTIVNPNVETYTTLSDFCIDKKVIPFRQFRWCTDKFKIRPMTAYVQKPCFLFIGFDVGESKRAKIVCANGIEHRFPLIEAGLARQDCIDIIKQHNLPVPQKSGCFICPFQKKSDWKKLRKSHPDLFCKAKQIETNCIEARKENAKRAIYLAGNSSLSTLIEEQQGNLFEIDDYPPCQCGL